MWCVAYKSLTLHTNVVEELLPVHILRNFISLEGKSEWEKERESCQFWWVCVCVLVWYRMYVSCMCACVCVCVCVWSTNLVWNWISNASSWNATLQLPSLTPPTHTFTVTTSFPYSREKYKLHVHSHTACYMYLYVQHAIWVSLSDQSEKGRTREATPPLWSSQLSADPPSPSSQLYYADLLTMS